MNLPKVFIIILQYNNSRDTIRCLNSVKELDFPNYNVIIVDNGSEVNPALEKNNGFKIGHGPVLFKGGVKHVNEIGNWIEKERNLNHTTHPEAEPSVRYGAGYSLLTTHSNLGYSGGNSIGIKHALENGADYVFILNPDTTLEKDTLTKLVKVAESNPQIGILGSATKENGKTVYGGEIKWLKPELSHLVVQPLSVLSGSTTKYYIPGAAMLIKRKVIEKIGLLDERYFLYFEDADYCERAKRSSFKLAIVPEAVVHHKPSSSTSSLGAPLLLRYHYRNAHLFNWKNGLLWVKFLLPFWSIFIIIKQLAKILFGKNREISEAIMTGVVDFYRGRFGHIADKRRLLRK